jgi:hypothetical protein
MEQTGLSANKLKIGMSRAGFSIDKAGNTLDAFGKEVRLANKDLKNITKKSHMFNMSLLSLLFAGMALQRTMGGFLRSAITSFQRANEDTEGLGKSTWELSAAWEFFKYSLVNALTQSDIFRMLVQWLVQIVQWFNKLSPTAKSFIIIGIAVLFVVGTLVMLFGQIGLAASGIKALGLTSSALWGIAIVIIGIIVLLKGFSKIWDNWGKDTKEVIKGIILALIGLAVIAAGIALMTGHLLFAGIMAAFVLILAAAYWVMSGFQSSWEDGFKRLAIAAGVLAAIFIIAFYAMAAAGVSGALMVFLAWAAPILALVAIVALVVFAIIKYWTQIKIFFLKLGAWLTKFFVDMWTYIKVIFWGFIMFAWNWNMTLLEAYAWLTTKINQGFVWLWYGIKKLFIEGVKFILGLVLDAASKLVDLFAWIPGLGSIGNILKKGIDKAKGAIDGWGNALEETRDKQLAAAEAPLDAVKKLKDAGNEAFKQKIKQIAEEGEATKNMIDDSLKRQVSAINAAAAAKKKAQDESIQEQKETKGTGILGQGVGQFLPQSMTTGFEGFNQGQSSSSVNNVNNVTNYIDATSYTPEQIKQIANEGMGDDISSIVDSSNN